MTTRTARRSDGAAADLGAAGIQTTVMPRVDPVRARRHPALLGLGVALVILGVLSASWLVSAIGARTPVLALARDVPFGATVQDGDLTVADVSVDPTVRVVPATDRATVVGRVAASTLRAGSLLDPDDVTETAPPAAGWVLVGVAVAADRMPAGGVEAGDRVLVVDTPAPGADPPAEAPASITATVVRRGEPDLDGVTVIDVTVPASDGAGLAARAATGRVAVVLLPRGR